MSNRAVKLRASRIRQPPATYVPPSLLANNRFTIKGLLCFRAKIDVVGQQRPEAIGREQMMGYFSGSTPHGFLDDFDLVVLV